MKRLFAAVAALGAVALIGVADAQPYGRGRGQPVAVLFELPGFAGRQAVVRGNSSNLPREFNDMAMSGRFEGRWLICEHSDYRGRCVEVEGDVADLQTLGFAQRVSSLATRADPYQGRGDSGYDGGYSGDRRSAPAQGDRNVFFPYPTNRGADIYAGADAADQFCRNNGLGRASFYDTAPGRSGYGGQVLRDVLCRR